MTQAQKNKRRANSSKNESRREEQRGETRRPNEHGEDRPPGLKKALDGAQRKLTIEKAKIAQEQEMEQDADRLREQRNALE